MVVRDEIHLILLAHGTPVLASYVQGSREPEVKPELQNPHREGQQNTRQAAWHVLPVSGPGSRGLVLAGFGNKANVSGS